MYAQTFYEQKLAGGEQTIAQDGSFLTSFSNLLERFGEGIDPVSLNGYFLSTNTYLHDANDGTGGLTWGSVSRYDGNIAVSTIGATAVPSSETAIVKFANDQYCLVDHIISDQVYIVDSQDGIVKGPGAYQPIYGLPIAWATYVRNTPIITTQASPDEPLVEIPEVEVKPAYNPPVGALNTSFNKGSILLIKKINAYDSPGLAKAGLRSITQVDPGSYTIFSERDGMYYVTKGDNGLKYWVNPADNEDKPIAPIEPEKIPAEPKLHQDKFEDSYVAFIDKDGYEQPEYYVANKNSEVINFGVGSNKPLRENQHIWISGVFAEDDILYGLPTVCTYEAEDGTIHVKYYYGIVMSALDPAKQVYDSSTTLEERQAMHTITLHDREVLLKANIKKFMDIIIKPKRSN